MKTWNDECLKRQYERVKRQAIDYGFTEDELKSPYLDKLSHLTKSCRISKMITLAYYLGWLRGISYVDEGKTPVTLG